MEPLSYWAICGWFMAGVALLQLFKFLRWLQKPREERGMSLGQCLALKGQGLIVGFAGSWLWVSGRVWALLGELNLPLLDTLGVVKADALGSIMAGFLLEALLLDRVVGWITPSKKKS